MLSYLRRENHFSHNVKKYIVFSTPYEPDIPADLDQNSS